MKKKKELPTQIKDPWVKAEPGERAGEKKEFVAPGESPFKHIEHRRKRQYLAAYSLTGSLVKASEATEISRFTHRHWKETDPEYAEAFQLAYAISTDILEDEARRRAIEGVQEPVFYQGKIVGHKSIYSDMLLLAMLKRHKGYADNVNQTISDNREDQKAMAHLRNLPPEKLEQLMELLGVEESDEVKADEDPESG